MVTTFPPEIREDIGNEMLDRMWRAHEARRRGALQECLEIAFDAFAEGLTRTGRSLTHTLLWEQIPRWMLDWAIEWRWRPSLLFLDTQWTAELIRSLIAHRITYWEAKSRLHQSVRQETSTGELSIVALFNRICAKKNMGIEPWLEDHPHIKRTTFMAWKAAGGNPVKGRVAEVKAREINAAILRDAVELGLIDDTVHDNVHDV